MTELERAVQQLSEVLLPAMRARVAEMGVEASGAFEFYRVAVERERVFNPYEIDLVNALRERLPHIDEIHEIGCGWGQLVFLLAWSGFNTTGYEIDERRYAGAMQFHRLLGQINPQLAGRAQFLNEFFPPLTRPKPMNTLAVSTNIVIGNPRLRGGANTVEFAALSVFGGQYRSFLLRPSRVGSA